MKRRRRGDEGVEDEDEEKKEVNVGKASRLVREVKQKKGKMQIRKTNNRSIRNETDIK